MKQKTAYLERILDPIRSSFTPGVARKLSELSLDSDTTARLDLLANKSTEGTLSEEERSEYEAYVHTLDILAILQTQARDYLAQHGGGGHASSSA